MNEVLERIDEELKKQGDNTFALANAVGVAPSTYYTWRKSDKIPDSKYLVNIAEYLGTSVDYLLTGKRLSNAGLSEDETTLIETYRTLDSRDRVLLAYYIVGLLSRKEKGENEEV